MGGTDPPVNPQMGVIEAPLIMELLAMSGMDPPMIMRGEPLHLPHPPSPGPALHRLAFKVKWYMFVLNS